MDKIKVLYTGIGKNNVEVMSANIYLNKNRLYTIEDIEFGYENKIYLEEVPCKRFNADMFVGEKGNNFIEDFIENQNS